MAKKDTTKKDTEDKPKGKTYGYAVFEGAKYLLTYIGKEGAAKAKSLAGKKPTVNGLKRKVETVSKERFKKLEARKTDRIKRIEKAKDKQMLKGKMPTAYRGEIA